MHPARFGYGSEGNMWHNVSSSFIEMGQQLHKKFVMPQECKYNNVKLDQTVAGLIIGMITLNIKLKGRKH